MNEETAERLRSHRDELSLLLAEAMQEQRQLEAQLAEIKEVTDRLRQAIEVLDPTPAPPKATRKPKSVAPSEASVQKVRAAIDEHFGDGRDFTVPELTPFVNVSHDTVRRSVLALRTAGEVRATGARPTNDNGAGTPAKTFALMPEEINA